MAEKPIPAPVPVRSLGHLPSVALVRYGTEDAGWVFSTAAKYRLSLQPVYDPSDRKVVAKDYTLTITDTLVVDAGESIDEAVNAARDTLLRAGMVLTVQNACIGSFVIAPPFAAPQDFDARVDEDLPRYNDIHNGPKPKSLNFRPIAGLGAMAIEWTVAFRLSECLVEPAEGIPGDPILGLGFEVTHTVDDSGLVSRQISGEIQFAANLNNGRLRNPDDIRLDSDVGWDERLDKIFPPLPTFRRSSQRYTLAKDRTSLRFFIQDDEHETAYGYPAGVVSISGSFSTSGKFYAAPYSQRLECAIKIPKPETRAFALTVFQDIARQKGLRADDSMAGKRILLDFTINEQLYSNTISIQYSWNLTDALDVVLANGSVLKPLTNTWENWALSIKKIRSAAGLSGLVWDPSTEVIVDLCADDPLPTITYSDPANPAIPAVENPQAIGDESQEVTPENSWIMHKSTLEVQDAGARAAVYDVCRPSASGGTPDLNPATLTRSTTVKPRLHNPETATSGVVQKLNTACQIVRFSGGAQRVRYPVPCPEILAVGETAVTLAHRRYKTFQVGTTASGVPIIGAFWDVVYLTTGPIGDVPLPPSHVATTPTSVEHIPLVS